MRSNPRKNYVVRLRLFLGGYEKMAVHAIRAVHEDQAGTLAIEAECHNDPVWEDDDKQECWDDYMVYRVEDIEELGDTDFALFARYLDGHPRPRLDTATVTPIARQPSLN